LALTQNKTSCLTTAFPKNPIRVFGRVSLAILLSLLFSDSCMPKCKETLLQVKQRLTREQRLRTEKRLRELLEPEQLAVTEDHLEDSDSELEVTLTSHSKSTVSSQVILILFVCIAWIAVVAYVFWFNRSHICYRI
jgi:hypothetical protein